MAGDAVEVVLVALIAAAHGSAKPHAGLDCAAAYEVVALAGEGFGGWILWDHGKRRENICRYIATCDTFKQYICFKLLNYHSGNFLCS
jgi:hypothetical protein